MSHQPNSNQGKSPIDRFRSTLKSCQNSWRSSAEKEQGFKRQMLLFAAGPAALPVACLLVLLVIFSLIGFAVFAIGGGSTEPASSASESESATSSESESEWVEPEEDKNYDATQGVIDTTVYEGTVLQKTEDAGEAYVNSTLFIGDSNTVRYMMYGKTSLTNDIGVVSMGAGAITTLGCVDFKGYSSYVTIPKAVAVMQPERIIICFGTNNLSGTGTNASSFISTYQKGIQAIVDAYPSVDVIVSSIPPLDKLRSNTNLYQSQIDAYNKAIVDMCEANGWKYLNTAETLKDENTGWAKTDYTLSDGVHLSMKAVDALFEYVRTHSYITADDRPKPLKAVPGRNETPVGLITSDPIAVRGQKTYVPVEFTAGEGGWLEGSTSQSVAKGGTCSAVKAVAADGYHFSYWSASVGSVGSSSTLVFTVPNTADANGVLLKAHFEEDEEEATATPTKEPDPTATPTPIPTATPTNTPIPTQAVTTPQETVAPPPTQNPTPEITQEPTPEITQEPTPQETEAPPAPPEVTEEPQPEPEPQPNLEAQPNPKPEPEPQADPEPSGDGESQDG